jgi:hypothetical protein
MKSGGWLGLFFYLAASCGQELELPVAPAAPGASSGAQPTSGITGLAGAVDETEPPRLPVSDTPLFTEAGAGGDAGEAGGVVAGGRAGSRSADPMSNAGAAGTHDAGQAGEGGAGGSRPSGPPALLLTEYVEGSASLKALEIYAISAASLEGCDLETFFNGKLVPGKLALHGTLTAGQTHVLCSATLATAQPQLCSRSTNLTFNGDDALALTCQGHVLDVIGQLGVDPGESWGKGATADHTLRRRCEVKSGRVDGMTPFDPALEWSSFSVDTFADLGQRSCP